jgi:ABC transport system ATP-binding/permease protein
MSILSLNKVTLHLANNTILNNVDWQIHPKERIALVGRNGAGKSTLIKLLQGELTQDSGQLNKQSGLRVAGLMQDVPISKHETVYHFLVHHLGKLGEVLSEYRATSISGELDRMATCQEQIETLNAWDMLPRVESMASHLSLPMDASMNSLSGGMRRRALLGAALLADADLLLLDEPTNHLDVDTIEWLEGYLNTYPGSILVVTHDRQFLANIANCIVEIDRGALYRHACDYETYLDRQEANRVTEQTHNALFDKRLKEEEAWLRQGVKARRTRNEGRVRRLEAMRNAHRERRNQTGQVKSVQLDVSSSGKMVVEAKNIDYSIEQKQIISDFSCVIMRGDKIGIIGPNGCGKTTLVRLLLGDLKPSSGSIRLGTSLKIAYFDQLRRELDETQTVMANVGEGSDFVTINGQSKHVASYLRDFLFEPERFNQPVSSLSGGERNRLLLAKLFAKPVNLLVMDEPTNDLDIETLELLESMLGDYPGTLIVISHDRKFINNIVSSVLVFEGNGHFSEFFGGYEDYRRHQKQQESLKKQENIKKSTPKTAAQIQKKPASSLSTAEQRELKQLPKRIEQLEARIKDMHTDMALPEFYERPADEMTRLTEACSQDEAMLSEAYARWELLEDRA